MLYGQVLVLKTFGETLDLADFVLSEPAGVGLEFCLWGVIGISYVKMGRSEKLAFA